MEQKNKGNEIAEKHLILKCPNSSLYVLIKTSTQGGQYRALRYCQLQRFLHILLLLRLIRKINPFQEFFKRRHIVFVISTIINDNPFRVDEIQLRNTANLISCKYFFIIKDLWPVQVIFCDVGFIAGSLSLLVNERKRKLSVGYFFRMAVR